MNVSDGAEASGKHTNEIVKKGAHFGRIRIRARFIRQLYVGFAQIMTKKITPDLGRI